MVCFCLMFLTRKAELFSVPPFGLVFQCPFFGTSQVNPAGPFISVNNE
jgi:hypothetical protein